MLHNSISLTLLTFTLASLSSGRMERSHARHHNLARHYVDNSSNSHVKRGGLGATGPACEPIKKTIILTRKKIASNDGDQNPSTGGQLWAEPTASDDKTDILPIPDPGMNDQPVIDWTPKDEPKDLPQPWVNPEDHSKDDSPPQNQDDGNHDPAPSLPANSYGLMGLISDNCGASGATDEYPNGSEAFLTCGISTGDPDSKWRPPAGVTLQNIAYVPLAEAFDSNPDLWRPCMPYRHLFEQYGASTGVPPILLASIALQESTCNAWIPFSGAHGLMQITPDKCGSAPDGNCEDPDYNVRTGAEYLRGQIDAAGGNLLQALGQYNGWTPNMSFNGATAARWTDCCTCQNNLDYLHQMLNHWILNKNGYAKPHLYHNLDVCYNYEQQ